jgi:hypothetical protein
MYMSNYWVVQICWSWFPVLYNWRCYYYHPSDCLRSFLGFCKHVPPNTKIVVEIKTWLGAVLESYWMYGETQTLDVLLTTKSCLERRIRLILDVCNLGVNDDKPRRTCDGF